MAICRVRSFLRSKDYTFTAKAFLFQLSQRFSSNVPSGFEKIGFIGLGNMGSRMANNLIKAGYTLTVHDINCDALKKFSEMGVETKETPRQIAEASDVVITMLPSSAHVNNVYTGPDGLLNDGIVLRPWLLIDSSTIDPHTSRRISQAVFNFTSKGNNAPAMLDAPVSGGVLAAEAGTLTFMIGGSEEVYLRAKPLFLSMGKNLVYCGGPGNGSAAKICNNLALAISMIGTSEALALGQSLGISATTLSEVFNSSSARCWSSDSYNPVPGVMEGVPSSRDYDGGFASKLMAKDLNLADTSAKEVDFHGPFTSQAQKIYTDLCRDGHESKDFSCVFRHYYSGKDEI